MAASACNKPAILAMRQQSLPMFSGALFGRVLDLLLRRQAFFARCEFRFGAVREPTPHVSRPDARTAAPKRLALSTLLPPSSSARMRSARLELAGLLDAWPGGRRMQPSLALIERALHQGGGAGIDRISPCVLRHAAASLDILDPLRLGPGLVELRRRIGLLLRRIHGGESPSSPGPVAQRASDGCRTFEDSLTEFIELDALMGECHF